MAMFRAIILVFDHQTHVHLFQVLSKLMFKNICSADGYVLICSNIETKIEKVCTEIELKLKMYGNCEE